MEDVNSDYDQMCAICLEKWTSHGDHKALSLYCGHTFGCVCIKRWVKLSHNCPICKRRTSKYEMSAVLQNVQRSCENRQSSVSDIEQQRILARARRQAARERRAMLRRMALAESTDTNVSNGASESAGSEV